MVAREKTPRRRYWFVLVAGICLAGVAVAVTGAWFFFAHQTRQAVNQWAEAQRQNDIDASWQDLEITGFPFRIDAKFHDPLLIAKRQSESLTWRPSFLTFKLSPDLPRAITYAAPGSHEFTLKRGDHEQKTAVKANLWQGQALFPEQDYSRLETLDGLLEIVFITPPEWPQPITVGGVTFSVTTDPNPPTDTQAINPTDASLALDLKLRNITLPSKTLHASAELMLGRLISAASLEAQVKGAFDFSDVDAAKLAAWRDAGGTVEVDGLELIWGPVRASANGTLALDSDLQPVGAFATQVSGLEFLVTALENSGAISPNDAAVARITLAVLTRADENGGPNRAEIPVTLQDRVVRLGPVALTELPPIDWE